MNNKNDFMKLGRNFFNDNIVCTTTVILLLFVSCLVIFVNIILGIIVILSFLIGSTGAIVLSLHREYVELQVRNIKEWLGIAEQTNELIKDCDVCGIENCGRHIKAASREPWKGLFVDKELDAAVTSFYTRILNSFVASWFSLLSKDDDFLHALKENLREATCRLILKLKEINAATLLCDKLLPCTFAHYEMVQKMIADGIPLGKLARTAIINERPIHPAVVNRKSEIDYLRAVAKCLIPRLCNNENLSSKVCFSLVRELLACWVLLPLMDVISDPNLLNLLVLIATNKSTSTTKSMKLPEKSGDKVTFLAKFCQRHCEPIICIENSDNVKDDNNSMVKYKFLTDQRQLYSFMQFLKKEGAVDVLRFYLDVDNLNTELMDPKVTTDPAKLSSLYQQSEKLLKMYQTMMQQFDNNNNGKNNNSPCSSLIEAHQNVKTILYNKWRKGFYSTPEYYRLVYGSREIKEIDEILRATTIEPQYMFRLGSKLKGAIRGAIDGAPLEATEVPTVWDALTDDQQTNSVVGTNSIASGGTNGNGGGPNSTIYNSVTQKLRKERGKNLESFIVGFMQSIDASPSGGGSTNEDVILMTVQKKKIISPPGRNLVFGDLFELKSSAKYFNSSVSLHDAKGPSQCLIYILVRMLRTPLIIIRFVLALINVSQSTVDMLIGKFVNKLIKIGLFEPRLTMLITLLEHHLFDTKKSEPSPTELHERQRQAKQRLNNVYNGLGNVADVLQSPPLNKHLMYSLFDILLTELYPELDNLAKD